MNQTDTGFEYLSDEKPQIIQEDILKNKTPLEEPGEFIKGLPDWDLEPPYEIVRRKEL